MLSALTSGIGMASFYLASAAIGVSSKNPYIRLAYYVKGLGFLVNYLSGNSLAMAIGSYISANVTSTSSLGLLQFIQNLQPWNILESLIQLLSVSVFGFSAGNIILVALLFCSSQSKALAEIM
jgi:hypothetical protein